MLQPEREGPRACPFCANAAGRPAFPYRSRFGGTDYSYFACSKCATRYIDPVPDAATFEQIYAPGDYHDVYYGGEGQGPYGETAKLLGRHLPAGARILDYGCGAGHLIRALSEAGFAASGGEFSASAAANAVKQSGCPVFDLSDGSWQEGELWDCIHLGDVIEHLAEPRDTFGQILASLKPGGLISAEGPLEANASLVNMAAALTGWSKQRLRPENIAEFPPYHLIFTNADAQRAFFVGLGGLSEVYWEISEDGWPYLANGGVRAAIAHVSIALSKTPLIGSHFGNRFRALYRKAGGDD